MNKFNFKVNMFIHLLVEWNVSLLHLQYIKYKLYIYEETNEMYCCPNVTQLNGSSVFFLTRLKNIHRQIILMLSKIN